MGPSGIARAVLAAAIAVLALATTVAGQSESPIPEGSPSAAPVAAGSIGREGWLLATSDAPAASAQLPPTWSLDGPRKGSLLAATSAFGTTFDLAAGGSSAEGGFEAYVSRLERRLEKLRKADVATVFRSVPGGLVARLDLPPAKGKRAPARETLFLFPACEDGPRTVRLTGEAPAANADGSPDEWDLIAAAVNPCSIEPAPLPAVDDAIADLAAAYLGVSNDVNPRALALVAPLESGGDLKAWRANAGPLSALYADAADRLEALPWTPETMPLGQEVVAVYRSLADTFGRLTDPTKKKIRDLVPTIGRQYGMLGEAGRAARLALGLPTVPQ